MKNTSIPLRPVGCPDRLALVEISGRPRFSSKASATADFDCRMASRPGVAGYFQWHLGGRWNDQGKRAWPEFPGQQVKPGGSSLASFLRHQNVGHQKGQRPLRLTSFGLEHTPDRLQVHGVGNDGIKGVSGDRNNSASVDDLGGPIDSFGIWLFGTDFD